MDDGSRTVQQIASDVGNAASELYSKLDLGRELREHPYRTLAIAAGVGYVIGGGLFTPFTAGVLRIGVRAAAIPALQTMLADAMEGQQG